MVWSEALRVMLVTHAKWRTFTQRPIPPSGSCGMMLFLALESRAAVDAMNEAAAAHGGQADVNPMEDHGFMYTCDLADPDGHMWGHSGWTPRRCPRPLAEHAFNRLGAVGRLRRLEPLLLAKSDARQPRVARALACAPTAG